MASKAPTVEAFTAYLRGENPYADAPDSYAALAEAYGRFTRAMADVIDAVRVHEDGSYAIAVQLMETVVHSMPSPPKDDFEGIVESLNRQPSAPVDPLESALGPDVEMLTLNLHDPDPAVLAQLPPELREQVEAMIAEHADEEGK